MQIDLTKTIAALAPLQISDFIEVDHSVVRAVAAASNGAFLNDRATLSAREFFAKYFAGYELFDTTEKQDARRAEQRALDVKAKRTKKQRDPLSNQYGNYIIALWESGGEFAVSYRKTTHISTHWNVLSQNEIEYKVDGRRFAVVLNTSSRLDAMSKKDELINEMVGRGFINKGDLPV